MLSEFGILQTLLSFSNSFVTELDVFELLIAVRVRSQECVAKSISFWYGKSIASVVVFGSCDLVIGVPIQNVRGILNSIFFCSGFVASLKRRRISLKCRFGHNSLQRISLYDWVRCYFECSLSIHELVRDKFHSMRSNVSDKIIDCIKMLHRF